MLRKIPISGAVLMTQLKQKSPTYKLKIALVEIVLVVTTLVMRNARTKCIFQIQLVLILANDIQLWRHDTDNNQLVNKKNGNAKLSVDSSWAVPTGTSTIMIDQSTNPQRVYGLEGDDDDVTTNPKVVEEDLKDSDGEFVKKTTM